ncbi:MAG: hypothetical protein LIP02_04135 [Bacteroidales bacterium]|nr:hypothetical protein [Bacteroidales bacterium]
MLYNLSNELQRNDFLTRAQLLAARGDTVELTSKRPRSLRQNAYLHVIIGYLALQLGEDSEYVKREYFKILCNPATFIRETDDRFRGKIKTLRSTASLTTEEMTLCVNRFRDWAAREAGVYLPSPDENELVAQMEVETSRGARWLD